MLKKILVTLVIVILVSSLVLAGCSTSESSGSGGANGSNSGEKVFLSIGTGGTGGAWYGIMAAASSIVNTNSQTINLDVQATGGSVENMKLLKNKTAQLGNATPDTAYFSYKGEREFKEAYADLRAVMAGNSMFEYIMVKADSNFKTMKDLDGATISIGAPGSATAIVGEAVLKSLGINFKPEYLAHSEAAAAINDGTIDAMMALSGIPFAAATELTTTTDIRFIELMQEEIVKIAKDNPYWAGGVLPAGTYKGQDKDVSGIGVGTVVLADKNVPEDAVYQLLQILLKDNHGDWVKAHKLAEEFSIETMKEYVDQKVILMPVHPGAKKFFEEQGIKFSD
jgi:TRAP transporter TAXI family solute receptor